MDNLKASSDTFFQHEDRFVLRHGVNPDVHTFLIEEEGRLEARMHICIRDHKAISMFRSSFGGFDMSDFVSEKTLHLLVDQLLTFLNNEQIKTCEITAFPRCYDSYRHDLMDKVLQSRGFRVAVKDETHYYQPSVRTFTELADPDERRHLRHARQYGWTFRQLNPNFLADAYELITLSLAAKGYQATLSFEELENNFRKFPDAFLLFGIFGHDEIMRSAAVCVRVNKRILYDLAHGDNPEKRRYSAIIPLLEGLYNFARDHRISLLDIGTSTLNGVRNEGLYYFKKKLGTAVSEKLTYHLEL